MGKSIALLLLLTQPLLGATYYVATTGNNAADGSSGAPWRNIWYAARTAASGDRVEVAAGVYNEFITNTVNGVTFAGAGASTIIDPSTDIGGGWSATSDFGAGLGIYKKTGLPFTVRELTIANQRVAFASTPGALGAGKMEAVYAAPAFTAGWQLLTNATGQNITTGTAMDGTTIPFWTGLEALYCATGTVCYLKLRDGSDPSSLSIRISPNQNSYQTVNEYHTPAINLDGRAFCTYSNFWIRNAFAGVYLHGTGCFSNVISNCKITAGYARIVLDSGPHSNVIRSNELSSNFYGGVTGAWDGGTGTYYSKEYNYTFSKYVMAVDSSSFDNEIRMQDAGGTNRIFGNWIHGPSLGSAVNLNGNAASPMFGTLIYNNTISDQPSTGITFGEGITEAQFFGNLVTNCNSQVRWHKYNNPTETQKRLWAYRNRFQLPTGVGNHIFVYLENTGATAYHPTNWVYQNSFSGGNMMLMLGSTPSVGMTNTHFVNNIVSGVTDAYQNAGLGQYDYNLLAASANTQAQPWYGANNIVQAGAEWANAAGMSMALTNGSVAIDAALDLPSVYPALPQTSLAKVGQWDIGALESGASQQEGVPASGGAVELRAGTVRVGNLIRR